MQPWHWCEAFLWRSGHYTKGMMSLSDFVLIWRKFDGKYYLVRE